MNPITSWVQSGMTSPADRQFQHDVRILKNTSNASSLNTEWNMPVKDNAFVKDLENKDEKVKEIGEGIVGARRLGKNVLNDAISQVRELRGRT